MKILTVIGARPQFIKAAVLSRAFQAQAGISEYLVHTGQHFDDNMSAVFFEELGLRQADCNLNIQGNSNIDAIGRMMPALEKVFHEQSPDLVLVYGDTNSTLAASLTARMCGIKLAHVEAGMRHGDLSISEEMNRVLTDQVSDYLFCSSQVSMDNLNKEGFENKQVQRYLSGDLMIDAVLNYSELALRRKFLLPEKLKQNYVICTLHRAENVDDKDKLRELLSAIDTISQSIPVVLPLHPRTLKRMTEYGLSTSAILMEPVGYLDMLNLVSQSRMLITDSGGLQKEAYCLKKHTLLLRERTEWLELAENGNLLIAGTDKVKILEAFRKLLDKKSSFTENFYGNGDAGSRIAKAIAELPARMKVTHTQQ